MSSPDQTPPSTPSSAQPADDGSDDLGRFFDEHSNGAHRADLDDEPQQIGARIVEARVAAGLTIEDIATRIGVKRSTVAKWESGERSPRGHRVSKLAGMLGVSISWILMGRGVEPAHSTTEIEQIRGDLDAVRARLDDVVNELAVLDQRLASLDPT